MGFEKRRVDSDREEKDDELSRFKWLWEAFVLNGQSKKSLP